MVPDNGRTNLPCILFICGGAFAGLDKVIRLRSEPGGIGFSAEVKSKDDRVNIGEVLAELEAADEVFITSTTRDLLPVMEIEGKQIGRSDTARKALAKVFGEYLRDYVASHKGVAA